MNEKNRRILLTVIGVLTCGFSVGLFNYSAFGMDPFQVFAHGIWGFTGMGFGTFYMIVNMVLLVIVFFIDKRKIGLGTFINMFLLGYVAEFSSWFFEMILPYDSIAIRFTALIAGVVIMSFAAALYYTGDMGVSTYDAIAIILSEKGLAKFKYIRIASDFLCVLIGALTGATVGIGTLISAFFMGHLISFFKKSAAEPLRYGRKTIRLEKITEEA